MKKNSGLWILILSLVVLIGAGYYSYRVVRGTAGVDTYSEDAIDLGLDLAGGVSITYEVVGDTPTQAQMSDTIAKLEQRAQSGNDGSIREPEVYQEGDDRINVDIPGATDEIFEQLQEPGVLEFRDKDGNVVFTGDDIKDAQGEVSQNSVGKTEYVVSLVFTDEAADKFYEFTAAHIGEVLGIYYNDKAISLPTINSAISGGTAQIDGQESLEEAKTLAENIRIGTLDLELKQLRANEVSAKLGNSAISTSLVAAGIGILIVIVFMLIMYLIPGLAASIALLIYTSLVILAIKAFGISLTLPGIAGIILGIGMAVDANVIIFARIKEEIANGKTVESAMKIGFQKAQSAIIDGNVTTFIAAVVLGILGSGTVKGFAYTLAIGIVLSMFTALFITRYILKAFFALGIKDAKFYGTQKERKPINFVGKKNIFFVISLAIIIAGFVSMGVHNSKDGDSALNYSLEFVGGTTTNVMFDQDYSVEDIENDIVPVVEEVTGDADIQTQKVTGTNQINIKTKFLTDEQRTELSSNLESSFGIDEDSTTFDSISSTVSGETRADAVKAVLVAMVLMLLYIWFRFKDIRFSASAVIALLHDILVVLAFYSIARVSVGNTFIACMLTIVGYSINATIVIFDRIRENLANSNTRDPERLREIANRSITQTLSRSINTSITTLIMVVVLFVVGVSSIQEFALPLMVGIICGGYSSVCITGSLWYTMKAKKNSK